MGEQIDTLDDLLRPGLRAVAVGINPTPLSVAVGHYYQGTYGQRFFQRLGCLGLLPDGEGFEDDRAHAAGIGFTDVVKRPSRSRDDVTIEDIELGVPILERNLAGVDTPVVIFVFGWAATKVLGFSTGPGWRSERLAGARCS